MSQLLDHFDFVSGDTTIAVIYGYFRKNGLFEYSIKYDDFIAIISKYMIPSTIKINKYTKCINAFNIETNDTSIIDICSLNKEFIVAVSQSSASLLHPNDQMLSTS